MKSLKERLRDRELTIGSWMTLGHTAVAEIMAKTGFDWLVVDMEHSAIALPEAQQLIQTIELSGITPLVRVGMNDSLLIKRVMDAGAHGVIVPMVNTKKDALTAVRSVRYPPAGTRGVGLARAQGYGLEFEKYRNWAEKESVVIVQIEHIDAINNLEGILTAEGVDASIIGPYDLSASMGHPGEFKRKDVKRALNRYVALCGRLRRPAGFHVVNPDFKEARAKIKEGFNFIAFGLDTLFLAVKCKSELSEVKKGRI